ncbi:MAG: bifunctional aldolase/short-chain dehydrogenase [Planctomycetota bacterium]
MRSRWTDADAEAAVARYAGRGVAPELALRVYTTRLLGADRALVLHGGGNTSVKTTAPDLAGAPVDVIHVKGSGWDMAVIEPEGLPAVRLEPLRALATLETLSDEDMVNVQRGNLLDCRAPNPSVETLLHAFLPHAYVDHTHADAVLALTDQPDGEAICAELYGGRVAVLPYIQPGFALARAALAAYEARPACEGLVLAKHGIFSFGATARESYERMIDLVTRAEERIGAARVVAAGAAPAPVVAPERIAPVLRGLVGRVDTPETTRSGRFVLDFRTGAGIRAYVDGPDVARVSGAGVVTPDHAIRIKPTPLLVPAPDPADPDAFANAARAALDDFVASYRAYFERNNRGRSPAKIPLDPLPRVILVPGVGLFGLGRSARDARIAADLAETTVRVVTAAESVGRFESLGEADLFEMEYWSLEQAKLAGVVEGPLARHVVVVTGGAGTIGLATARRFAAAGAAVALLDTTDAVEDLAGELGGLGVRCDVTAPDEVRAAFDRVCRVFGGVDIVVSNAGAARQGRIGEVDDGVLRESFELNFFAHQTVAQAAVSIMTTQGLGGVLLFNVSKQAVNPGRDFGPYGLPKAATLALLRQYAVDHGRDGIRANGVNADRIPGGMLTPELVRERSRARDVTEAEYLAGNLLHEPVTAVDVAKAFVDLACSPRTTGAVLTVDGGNIAAALR